MGCGGGSSSEGRGGKWYHIGQWVFELEEGPGVERMGLENLVEKFLKRKEWLESDLEGEEVGK